MPKAIEDNLKAEAAKKNLHGKAAKAYIFGTLNRVEQNKPGAQKSKDQNKTNTISAKQYPDRGGGQSGM